MQVWREEMGLEYGGKKWGWNMAGREIHVADHKLRLVSNHKNIDEVSAELRRNGKKFEKKNGETKFSTSFFAYVSTKTEKLRDFRCEVRS